MMAFAPAANGPPLRDDVQGFVAAFLDELADVVDLGVSLDLVRQRLEARVPRLVEWVRAVQVIDAHARMATDPRATVEPGDEALDLAERLAASLWIQGLDGSVDAALLREYAAHVRRSNIALVEWIDACHRWRDDDARCRGDEVLAPMVFERDGRLAGGPTGLHSWDDTCAQLDDFDPALGHRHRLRYQGPFLRPHVSLWS